MNYLLFQLCEIVSDQFLWENYLSQKLLSSSSKLFRIKRVQVERKIYLLMESHSTCCFFGKCQLCCKYFVNESYPKNTRNYFQNQTNRNRHRTFSVHLDIFFEINSRRSHSLVRHFPVTNSFLLTFLCVNNNFSSLFYNKSYHYVKNVICFMWIFASIILFGGDKIAYVWVYFNEFGIRLEY